MNENKPSLPKTIRCSCGSTSFESLHELTNVVSKKTVSYMNGQLRTGEEIESADDAGDMKPLVYSECGKENTDINELFK